MTDTKQASEKLVRDFLGSWEGGDLETICGAFADDAVYHNAPVEPIEGIAGIRAIFQAFLDAFAEAKLDVVTLAAEPGLVLAERVDYFTMNDGAKVVLPVHRRVRRQEWRNHALHRLFRSRRLRTPERVQAVSPT